jgi:very-short-patch-repair endonuclease
MPKKLTTEGFILRSKEIHGDKYDYSLVNYINNRTNISIIYNGVIYEQNPNNHLSGFKCENIKGLTSEEFIIKSKEIHGDKYDYSLVNFKNVRGKIKIIHNGVIYEQLAYAHLQGKSPEMVPIKITNSEFIRRSKEIHGDIFDYSLLECNGNKNNIKLIHNGVIYDQCTSDHLNGHLPKNLENMNRISKGVGKIIKNLTDKKIKYIREYKFKDCRNINYLRFDFYLPDYNILIEYDGRQHFESIDLWGGDIEFEKRKINDGIKNDYCKKNGISLLRISHLEDVDSKLNDFLIKHYI